MTPLQRIACLSTVSACVLAFSSAADANERWPRWYVGLSAGVAYVEDSDLSNAVSGDLEYDTGVAATASLGYMPFFGNQALDNVRIEAELGYRYQSLDSFSNAGVSSNAGDYARIVTYLANAYYDFRSDSQWTPYLGAGLGGASVNLPTGSGLGNTDEKDAVFAYQFLGGVTYAPTSIPMTEWGIGYRYFTADSPRFATATSHIKLDDITSHNIEANARFRF